jgi:hypothetical protein
MWTSDYPKAFPESNRTLTAADHLELASTLLEKEAADLVSGNQARVLLRLAEVVHGLALPMAKIGRVLGERWPV